MGKVMFEVSLKPIETVDPQEFEKRRTSTGRMYAGFTDNDGIIHALNRDMYGARFLPLGGQRLTPILFEGKDELEVVTQALQSGYRVFCFRKIDEMVLHFMDYQ